MRGITAERAIIFSIALHLLLIIGLRAVPASWNDADLIKPNVAEIEIIEKKSENEKKRPQVIRDVKVPDRMREDDNDQEARFFSAERRRVVAEIQARNTGLTNNGSSLPADSWMRHYPPAQKQLQAQAKQPRVNKNYFKWKDFNGYEPIAIPKPSQETGSRQAFQDAPSTVGEQLPNDVALGDFTALNTDRFKFYSFFSRVEELVRFRWETGLHQAIDTLPREYLLNVVGRRNWVTKVEFWILPDGHFHSAHIHQESGVKRFDFAAVNAFREAAVFPNPPRELVEEDGLIHLQYSFNVRWNPGLLSDR